MCKKADDNNDGIKEKKNCSHEKKEIHWADFKAVLRQQEVSNMKLFNRFFFVFSTWWYTCKSSSCNEIVEWLCYRKSFGQCWEHNWWWNMVQDTSQMTTTIAHFISYLFSLSLFAYMSNSSNFFSLALSFLTFFLLSHLFLLSFYFDYNQLKWSWRSHYTT